VATLPCPPSSVSRFIARCLTVLLAAATVSFAAGAEDSSASVPRPLLRLPRWIESLQDRNAKPPRQPLPKRPAVAQPATAAAQGEAQLTAGWTDLAEGKPAESKTEQPTESKTEQPADAPLQQPTTDAAPAATPVASTPDDASGTAIDPASFRGVYPGKTTREELDTAWGAGEPFSRDDGTHGFTWKIEPFERVDVVLDGDVVSSIRIKLADPVAVADLAKQLEIADLKSVSVLDEQGVSVGEVFPERGVVLSVNPGTRSAVAVMLEPLDPEAFILRAEGELDSDTASAVADLTSALQIDPTNVRALRLLLALRCEQGRWQDAKELAERAEKLDPVDVWTQIKFAGALVALELSDEARAKVTAVVTRPNAAPLVIAQGERMLGRVELTSPKPDYQKAVEHFSTAIRIATPLVGHKSVSVQQAARDVLLDAHLGTALAIAKGTWQQKGRVIPKWIARSETLVKDLNPKSIDKDVLELTLCRGALAVAAGSSEAIDPLPWVKRLLEVRSRLNATITDAERRHQLDWELGLSLADALVAAQKRGDASDMLENSTLTAAYLKRGMHHRQLTDTERKNVGELLFRIGILYSLQHGDHATAVTWFDQALPLWADNPAFARTGESGRLGESFVSMAISYWQVDRREDAMEISSQGVDLMVQAVDRQQIEERSLAVAYGNLSTMYAEQGDDEKSRSYAEMASRAEASGTVLK
jgi:tetratricopeptide (TPR) repeat protein